MRRKVLLCLVAFVPLLLSSYCLAASLLARGFLLSHGSLLVFTTLPIIAGIGGYVIWDCLTSLASTRATTRPVTS